MNKNLIKNYKPPSRNLEAGGPCARWPRSILFLLARAGQSPALASGADPENQVRLKIHFLF